MFAIHKYSIVPVKSQDLPTIISLVHTAKLPLTINRLMWKDWPNDVAQKRSHRKAVDSAFEDPLMQIWKVVFLEKGEIVGHLVLSKKPGRGEAKDEKQDERGEKPIPEGANTEVIQAVMDSVAKIQKSWEEVEHLGT